MMTICERWAVLMGALAFGIMVGWIWMKAVESDRWMTGEYEVPLAGERDPAILAALEKAMEAERRFRDGEKARERARAALKEMEAREINDGK